MAWIFPAFLIASALHMFEEYAWPGGFINLMKRFNPRLGRFVTPPMAIVFNGLQLVLCLAAIWVGESNLVFSLSVAGLALINAVVHIGAGVRSRGYAPGMVTGAVLYLPLAIVAYRFYLHTGGLSVGGMAVTLILGLVYQALPILYLAFAGRRAKVW